MNNFKKNNVWKLADLYIAEFIDSHELRILQWYEISGYKGDREINYGRVQIDRKNNTAWFSLSRLLGNLEKVTWTKQEAKGELDMLPPWTETKWAVWSGYLRDEILYDCWDGTAVISDTAESLAFWERIEEQTRRGTLPCIRPAFHPAGFPYLPTVS